MQHQMNKHYNHQIGNTQSKITPWDMLYDEADMTKTLHHACIHQQNIYGRKSGLS